MAIAEPFPPPPASSSALSPPALTTELLALNAFLARACLGYRWMVHTGTDREPEHPIPLGHRFLCEAELATTLERLGRARPATFTEPIYLAAGGCGPELVTNLPAVLGLVLETIPESAWPHAAAAIATQLAQLLGYAPGAPW